MDPSLRTTWHMTICEWALQGRWFGPCDATAFCNVGPALLGCFGLLRLSVVSGFKPHGPALTVQHGHVPTPRAKHVRHVVTGLSGSARPHKAAYNQHSARMLPDSTQQFYAVPSVYLQKRTCVQ